MVDLIEIEHLIDAMSEAVIRLEEAISKNNKIEIGKLKTFIFDLHSQINKVTAI